MCETTMQVKDGACEHRRRQEEEEAHYVKMSSPSSSCTDVHECDTEELSAFELRARSCFEFGYRFVLAVFLSCQLFDFLFNPIWMHGYLWCLNLPIEMDLSDKSAGVILDHQLEQVGYLERLLHAVLGVCAVIIVLRLSGYNTSKSVWHLLKLSFIFGLVSGLLRCTQLQHRLYSTFHEVFYIYLNFFVVGACMTLKVTERFSQPVEGCASAQHPLMDNTLSVSADQEPKSEEAEQQFPD